MQRGKHKCAKQNAAWREERLRCPYSISLLEAGAVLPLVIHHVPDTCAKQFDNTKGGPSALFERCYSAPYCAGFVEEMRFVAMRLHTKDQAPKEGQKPAENPWQKASTERSCHPCLLCLHFVFVSGVCVFELCLLSSSESMFDAGA